MAEDVLAMKCPYGKNVHVIGAAGTEGSAVLEFLSARFPRITLHAHDFHEEKSFLNASLFLLILFMF